MKYTDEEIKKIEEIEIDYTKAKTFFHCKECIEQFLGSPLHQSMTPKDYGVYEVNSLAFTYPDGNIKDIVVVWCKRCGKKVWDSRILNIA